MSISSGGFCHFGFRSWESRRSARVAAAIAWERSTRRR
jgi:hypothetical protein